MIIINRKNDSSLFLFGPKVKDHLTEGDLKMFGMVFEDDDFIIVSKFDLVLSPYVSGDSEETHIEFNHNGKCFKLSIEKTDIGGEVLGWAHCWVWFGECSPPFQSQSFSSLYHF